MNSVTHDIGIMQGRLVPPTPGHFQCFPREGWQLEFGLAGQAGLTCLEWIYDVWGADANPIETDSGIATMTALAATAGVAIRSVCADWFMEQPLLRATAPELEDRLMRCRWLLRRARAAGALFVVIPFVDRSAIESTAELHQVASTLNSLADESRSSGIAIHLETNLGPRDSATLLELLPPDVFRINYDSGNSAFLGFLPRDEFGSYGERIGSIHIKDRRLGGTTVALGSGDTDFESLFEQLSRVNYAGSFVLQVARGESGKEVSWASANRAFVEQRLASKR